MRLLHRSVTVSATVLVTALIVIATNVAPASAGLPPLYCRDVSNSRVLNRDYGHVGNGGELRLCIASMGNPPAQWAGIGVSGDGYFDTEGGNDVRLELVYFTMDQFPYGGQVLTTTQFFRHIDAGVRQTPGVFKWSPGVFCARLYNQTRGIWNDFACVDTNGLGR